MLTTSAKKTILCSLLVAGLAGHCAAADYFQVRGGIPNSQHFFQQNQVGNQYLFFIGNSVLAGADLKDAGLRYSAQMIQGFKRFFPESSIIETRHIQPGGSWFGLFRLSRRQAVFGEVICSGHLAILDFAADDRKVDIEQAYIEDSGKTYGWFMGDAVHANHRGCQIIGRLLEKWFTQ